MARSDAEIEAVIRELSRHGLGGINPDIDQLRSLLRADREGPLQFLNLLEYHDQARYPAGHELAGAGLTGAEAYARYGAVAFREVTRRGGSLTLYNGVEQSIIGDTGTWHHIATMQYKNTDAFIEMLQAPDYVASLVHRDAGLKRTWVLVTRPLLPT
ncbi:MAG TPA: hypothetical protein VEL28_14880 [Candidatus Binatia bacterium]|nr:hypothetical protein [Candidatus Binatia bacterium]